MQHKDILYLGHMHDMARKVAERIKNITRQEFDADEDLRLAIVHMIQIIGEAARRVSEGTQTEHPEILWTNIIGMRHKIVHDYFDIDEDIVWDVATKDIPPLLEALIKILPANPE